MTTYLITNMIDFSFEQKKISRKFVFELSNKKL